VHVEPIKPVLKAPGSPLLRLRYDGPLSNFAFSFNLRRYNLVSSAKHNAELLTAEKARHLQAGEEQEV
jgi:hypothetical protein